MKMIHESKIERLRPNLSAIGALMSDPNHAAEQLISIVRLKRRGDVGKQTK